jgi:hypothetical protein
MQHKTCPLSAEAPDAILGPMDDGPFDDIHRMRNADVLRVKLEVLKREHRDLDEAVRALQDGGRCDMLTLQRLKRKKLALKDRIADIEDRLLPDIIA